MTFDWKNNSNTEWQITHKFKQKTHEVPKVVSMESVKTTDVENKILFQKAK